MNVQQSEKATVDAGKSKDDRSARIMAIALAATILLTAGGLILVALFA